MNKKVFLFLISIFLVSIVQIYAYRNFKTKEQLKKYLHDNNGYCYKVLNKYLYQGDTQLALETILALSTIREKKSFEVLTHAAQYYQNDNIVFSRIVWSIGQFQNEDAINFLFFLLKKQDDKQNKLAIIRALGYIKSPVVLDFWPDIIANETDIDVLQEIANSVLHIKGDKRVLTILNSLLFKGDSILSEYIVKNYSKVKLDKNIIIDNLIDLYNKLPNFRQKLLPLKALMNFNRQDVVNLFVNCIKSNDNRVNRIGAEGLIKLRDSSIINQILPLLKSKNPFVRYQAARVIIRLGNSNIVQNYILPLQKDKNPFVKIESIAGEAKYLNPDSAKKLLKYLNLSVQKNILIETIKLFGFLKDPRFIDNLIPLLSSSDSYIKMNVLEALGEIKSPDTVSILSKFATSNQDPTLSLVAVKSLGNIKVKDSVNTLISVLDSKVDTATKIEALKSIVRIGIKDKDVIASLIRFLTSKNPAIRSSTEKALSFLLDSNNLSYVFDIITHYKQKDLMKRYYLREGLSNAVSDIYKLSSSKEIKDIILRYLNVNNTLLRVILVEIMGKSKDREFFNKLKFIVNNEQDTAVVSQAIDSLVNYGYYDEDLYIKFLGNSSPSIRKSAAKALGSFSSSTEAIHYLVKTMKRDKDFFVKIRSAASVIRISNRVVNEFKD